MTDRPARSEDEAQARATVVAAARAMLSGDLTFMEGAALILQLEEKIGGIAAHDSDFSCFWGMATASDHLPLAAQRQLWDLKALSRLEPEYERMQAWAAAHAAPYCNHLITRFSTD